MKRLFVAVKIIPEKKLVDAFEIIKKNLSFEKINWDELSKLHITLKFLGNTDENIMSEMIEKFQQISKKYSSFELFVENAGVFQTFFNPKVIWFGIRENNILKELAEIVDKECFELGFEKEKRSFKPHLTIGRVKYMKNNENLKKIITSMNNQIFQMQIISDFKLYESILTPEGAIYKVINEFKFES